MASGFRQANGRVIVGEGDPAEGDALCTILSLFPENTLYVNNNTGKLWVRNAENGVLADWVGASGAGIDGIESSGGNLTYTADTHTFNSQGTDFLALNGTVGSESARMRAVNFTGDGNAGQVAASTTNTEGRIYIEAAFNDGAKDAQINLYANATESEIIYTADTHNFVGAVIVPTSDPGVSGALWNNAGTPAISAGV